MKIQFKSKKLRKTCLEHARRLKEYGPECGKKLGRRLDDLRAAANLETMRKLPGRCHELKAERAGQLSIDLKHPMRLIFEPDHDPTPTKQDGGIDWLEVTCIKILEIEDYHG